LTSFSQRQLGEYAPMLVIEMFEFGNSALFVQDGWHEQEPSHRWCDMTKSTLKVENISEELWSGWLILKVDIGAFITTKVPAQSLVIVVNGHIIWDGLIDHDCTIRSTFNAMILNGAESLELIFIHPDHISPNSTDPQSDSRELSVSIKRISISKI